MEIINKEEIKRLASNKSNVCISIYIPTHYYGRETFEGEDMINFKSIIQKIENELPDYGIKGNKLKDLLKGAKELMNDTNYWRHQSKGLAVFIAPDLFRHFELPIEFTPFDTISNQFYLKPLMPLVFENGLFYLLSFSKDQVKLYEGTKTSITEIELENLVPHGIEEALMYDNPTSSGTLQHHSGQGGKANAIFHGHGGAKDTQKTDITRYLNAIDEGIMKLMKGDQVPLVLAAVDYLIPIYKSVSKYNYIVDQPVLGNQEYTNILELHEKAWKVVEPWIGKKRAKAISNYKEHPDASLVTSNPDRIIPAAFYKQVYQLFIEKGANIWGNFDEKLNKLDIHSAYQKGDHCLINEAAIHTVLNGGEVYTLSKEEMIDPISPMAAVLRFS